MCKSSKTPTFARVTLGIAVIGADKTVSKATLLTGAPVDFTRYYPVANANCKLFGGEKRGGIAENLREINEVAFDDNTDSGFGKLGV